MPWVRWWNEIFEYIQIDLCISNSDYNLLSSRTEGCSNFEECERARPNVGEAHVINQSTNFANYNNVIREQKQKREEESKSSSTVVSFHT